MPTIYVTLPNTGTASLDLVQVFANIPGALCVTASIANYCYGFATGSFGEFFVGNASGSYGNTAISGTATYGGPCTASCYTASLYTTTVPANTFFSTTSQADAQNQAVAYLTSVSQSNADTFGSCSFNYLYSTAISASVSKSDCGVGYIPSVELVSLPASYSFDSCSQANAQAAAQAYFNSISQSWANASGSCTFDSASYGTYNFQLGTAWDNDVTASIYPLTVSFYTTTSLTIPSESSTEWTTIGYFTSSDSYQAGRQSWTVTARKNGGLPNTTGSSASGSGFNLYKVRGANGEKIGVEPGYIWFTPGTPLLSASIAGYFYGTADFLTNTPFQNTASRDVQSKPHLSNDYTQSLRIGDEWTWEFRNGFSGTDWITGSVAGPLTMSLLVTSSTTFPSLSDPKWFAMGIMEQTASQVSILVQITGSSVYWNGSNPFVLGESVPYTTNNKIYYFKVEDAAGARPNWVTAVRTTTTTAPVFTRTYNNFPNTDMVSFRLITTGSFSNDKGQIIYFRNV